MIMIFEIDPHTRTILVCESCISVVAQLGQGKHDATIARLELNNHLGHEVVTLNRDGTHGKYRRTKGVIIKDNFLQ